MIIINLWNGFIFLFYIISTFIALIYSLKVTHKMRVLILECTVNDVNVNSINIF